MTIQKTYSIPLAGKYDIIVAGGGVAGVAAAVSAARENKKILIIEKQTILGGLATSGLITYFVPMCNGRGIQIIKGMAEEFLQLATSYGYDDIAPEWSSRNPPSETAKRLKFRYFFAIALKILTRGLLNRLSKLILAYRLRQIPLERSGENSDNENS